MDNIIYIDIDQTVLDYNGHWAPWLKDQGYTFSEADIYRYCRLTHLANLSEQDEMKAINDFFNSEHAFTLPALPAAKKAIQSLYNQGWRFVAITACPFSNQILDGRRANLEKEFGNVVDDVIIVGAMGSKYETLSRFKPTIWVEDNYANALAGHNLGYRTFLMNQQYNLEHDAPMMRVNDWSEIEASLCMAN